MLFCHAKFFKMNIFFWKTMFFCYIFLCVCLPKVYLKAPEESDPEDDDDPFRPSASRPMGSTSLRSSKSAKSLRPGGSSGEIIRKDSTCSQHSSRSAWILREFSRWNGKKQEDSIGSVLCSCHLTGPKCHSNFGQGQCTTGPKSMWSFTKARDLLCERGRHFLAIRLRIRWKF